MNKTSAQAGGCKAESDLRAHVLVQDIDDPVVK